MIKNFSFYILIFGISLFVFGCSANNDHISTTVVASSPVSKTPRGEATSNVVISSTILPPPSPTQTILPSATISSSPSPSPTKNLGEITPIVSPGPIISGTQNTDLFCYGVPEPQLNLTSSFNTDVLISGSFFLCEPNYSAIDLDNVIIGGFTLLDSDKSLVGADIHLRWGTASPEAWVIELDDVLFTATHGDTEPTLEQCKAEFEGYPYGGLLVLAGEEVEIIDEFGCFKTDEGRIGFIQIEQVNPIGSLSLKLNFTIWDLQ